MRWPRGLIKLRGSSVNKSVLQSLLCFACKPETTVVDAVAHFFCFCFICLTGRAWCKRATRTKGKVLISNIHISASAFLPVPLCSSLPPRTFNYFFLFMLILYSCREIRALQGFRAYQAQRVQKGSLVPGVNLAPLGPQVPLEEATPWTLRSVSTPHEQSTCSIAQH